jgi:beta-1,4-mannosyl-glycoprotein beta-1,4-N-acetylglucosaminyltransferase
MYDCIIINDELDLLELRLNILYSFFEKFIIIESDHTFSGIKKEYNFEKYSERFRNFFPKIRYYKHKGHPIVDGIGAWDNELTQRNSALDVFYNERSNDNMLFISDIDEIPKPESLYEAKCLCCKNEGYPIALELANCLYYFNMVADIPWRGPFLYNPDKAEEFELIFHTNTFSPTHLRWHISAIGHETDVKTIKDAGWHLSCMGGIEQIRIKIRSFAHIELNRDDILSEEHLLSCMNSGEPYYEKLVKFHNNLKYIKQSVDFLPDYIKNNLKKYEQYIKY